MNRVVLLLAFACMASCKREARKVGESPSPPRGVAVLAPDSGLFASTDTTLRAVRDSLPHIVDSTDVYGGNAYGTSEGKRLFAWMNCSGCHANGGGGIGPALMDAEWRYGGAPSEIYQTIVSGRPNGMPAFGNRLNTQQVWQLVAYVRSMSAQTPKWARPGRDDHMAIKVSEQQTPKAKPTGAHGVRP